ncbi:MAG: MFS transporter [Treponema sp.]|nr:MAG: MFS transporter [Treponema sp.]
MGKIKLNKAEKDWAMYDAGNSAFTLLSTTIVPLYFYEIAKRASVSSADYFAFWGYAASISTIIVMLLGPIAGAIADGKNMKKKVFLITLLVGTIATVLFSLPVSYITFLVILVSAKVAYQTSLVVYDSMIIDITTNDRMDTVSSIGYALGYILSCIPFIASIALIFFGEKIGISTNLSMIIAFIINAVWWFAFSVPLLKTYKQINFTKEQSGFITTFSSLWHSLKEIAHSKKILLFLIAFFFYIDGVYTIINMAIAYGKSVGLDDAGLLLALLVTQIIAFPSVIIFARLAEKFRTSVLIKICIVAYFFITLYAVQLDKLFEFWVLAITVGMFQGAVQALSRSYFGKIIPQSKSGKYFAVYDICGKGATFLGALILSAIAQITKNQSLGTLALPVMFIIGIIFFIMADKIKPTQKPQKE